MKAVQMRNFSEETIEIIKKIQEAIGRSEKRLEVLKRINGRKSEQEIIEETGFPQCTVNEAINQFLPRKLIEEKSKKNGSAIYQKAPLIKKLNLDRIIKIKLIDSQNNNAPTAQLIFKKSTKKIGQIPYLTSSEEEIAQKMAIPFGIIYCFENSLRKFINTILTKEKGSDWWNIIGLRLNTIERVKGRKEKEKSKKWHVPRGAHEIYYTDMDDLEYILRKEQKIFEKYIDMTVWPNRIKEELEISRNIIDHHNPVPQEEIKRLEIYLNDWKREFKNEHK